MHIWRAYKRIARVTEALLDLNPLDLNPIQLIQMRTWSQTDKISLQSWLVLADMISWSNKQASLLVTQPVGWKGC